MLTMVREPAGDRGKIVIDAKATPSPGANGMASKILVVDDEESMCNLLTRLLQREGYRVVTATRGREALQILEHEKPDLMILDLNLPDLSGENIYQSIRQDPRCRSIPILVITGRAVEGISARCLHGGADAFLSKPFDNTELLAYVHALLRRSKVYREAGDSIEKDGMIIEPNERSVAMKGTPVRHLSPKEFEVLKELVSRSPDVVEKGELAAKVWGTPLANLHPRTMDVHIRRIRKKIGTAGARCLRTIPAVGYQWRARP